MKKLIGYSFFKSQNEFEKWQLDNEEFMVHTVQPNANSFDINAKEKYDGDTTGIVAWGVFVTYSYKYPDAT